MKRVDPATALAWCDWRRFGTVATARRTGRGRTAAAGAAIETQIVQRLQAEVVAWVWADSSVLSTKINSMLLSTTHRRSLPASN
jgi:hypothetical protein